MDEAAVGIAKRAPDLGSLQTILNCPTNLRAAAPKHECVSTQALPQTIGVHPCRGVMGQ